MPPAAIHPGEELRVAAGFPVLSRFRKGDPGQPLVVFVTGGGVLPRIAYGQGGAPPDGFLAHWLSAAGYSFLGVSYPLANAVFARAYPEFTVQDWAAQTAELVAAVVEEAQLDRRVLVLAWSMAGRMAGPLNRRLQERDLALELFVAMAATPPLPNLLPALDQLKPTESGLADAGATFLPWLLRCLHVQNRMAGAELISDARFLSDYAGDFPVNLAATALRYRAGRFVMDADADCADTGGWDYAAFPALAALTHDSTVDARHALSDCANWSLHMVQSLGARRLWAAGEDLAELPADRFAELTEVVGAAPERLSARVPGTHLFFVGEAGARATVRALGELRSASCARRAALARARAERHAGSAPRPRRHLTGMAEPGTPTLDQLRVFLTVVETGSFAAAARRLGRATSVISYAVANLEAQLGLALFDREGTRRPQLTVAGRALLGDARTVAHGIDGLRARVRGLLGGLEAEVNLAVDVMLPTLRVVDALKAFQQEFPTVALRLHVEALGAVAQLVLDRTAVLGVSGPLVTGTDGLERIEVGMVELIPVARPDHPLANEAGTVPGAARQHVQLVLTDRSTLTEGRDFAVVATRTWRLADLGAKHALLLAGLGWGKMPAPMVAEDLRAGRLVRLRLAAGAGDTYRFHAIYRTDAPPGPAAAWLLRRLLDQASG